MRNEIFYVVSVICVFVLFYFLDPVLDSVETSSGETFNSGGVILSTSDYSEAPLSVLVLLDFLGVILDFESEAYLFPQSKSVVEWDEVTSSLRDPGSELDRLVKRYPDEAFDRLNNFEKNGLKFFYRSNGLEFIVLVFSSESHELVSRKYPELVFNRVPAGCKAFGFWTEGAERWWARSDVCG